MSPVTQQPTPPQAFDEAAVGMRADARRNREKVLKAARVCLARDGLDAQMEEISRRAKVGVGTVYRHFPTKDDLVFALAGERFDRLAENAQAALGQDDPWAAFCDFLRSSAEIQISDRALSEVLLDKENVMREHAERVGILELVGKLMERAKAAGELRKDAEPEDVPMLMCALGGAAEMPLMSGERYLALVIDGFRAPGITPMPKRPPRD
jgi:AcrR family transcriptional regulator